MEPKAMAMGPNAAVMGPKSAVLGSVERSWVGSNGHG